MAVKKTEAIRVGPLPGGTLPREDHCGRRIEPRYLPARRPSGLRVLPEKKGKVKLVVTSEQGKEAIVAILSDGEFFGEGCLTHQRVRMATAIAAADCKLFKIDKALMTRLLNQQPDISKLFLTQLLSRNIRYEGDLVDQLFNSSEKRLARTLLLRALWQGQPLGVCVSPDQAGELGPHDRHHPVPGQPLHEQVSEDGFYRLRR